MKKNNRSNLIKAAKKAKKNAYSPYSGFKVGAALLGKSGVIFEGCNVENATFGATTCAERGAVQAMVAAGQKTFSDLVVVTDASPPWPPCGICRQVLAEFADDKLPILLLSTSGDKIETTLGTLFPQGFSKAELGIAAKSTKIKRHPK